MWKEEVDMEMRRTGDEKNEEELRRREEEKEWTWR
jgi:hypothetical protein